ncbi:serine/threonine protein kinase [Pseudomaricurvus alkylphenolicus]|uniref:D-Ala-D-Ala carboxypeptidase family metallohydrolase n=1 Tax=Pseudomaricurvus alkylphenolicus TaxID=1306991 RepID=UPI00142208D8|nr:D-Ala-D-Ala carboxypeptidase family metallohydrolase [Pseudomaricurvus alkylphenolicus]NIB43794.1 serine/threonine protein kinase [Pseudomaricurvus alkylphenolicus]
MGDLTQNFSRSEFECPCGCGLDTVDAELLRAMQDAVFYFAMPTHVTRVYCWITSGCRCKRHNRKVGGEDESLHLIGRAADHVMEQRLFNGQRIIVDTDVLADYYDRIFPNRYGIGKYPDGRVHFDTRTGDHERWDERKPEEL